MDTREYVLFQATMIKFLHDVKSKVNNENIGEINRLESLIDQVLDMGFDGTIESIPSDTIIDEFWEQVETCISDLSEDNKKVRNYADREDFAPNFWLWKNEIPISNGYSEKHVEMLQSKQNPSGRHVYKSRPKQIEWKLQKIVQQGSIPCYVAIVPLKEVDAVSSVPAIKPNLTTMHSSVRVLNRNLGDNQWQRSIDPKRIMKIGKFLDNSKNGIANAPMIFAPDHQSIRMETDSDGFYKSMIIDFTFLKEDNRGPPFLTDHSGLSDRRPLQIIDGQHRVRGGMRSKRGSNLNIPIIIFPQQIRSSGAAKFFAEINTLSEPLNILHELYMRHKFELSSTKPGLDFSSFDGTSETNRSRANKLAYESAANTNIESVAMENLIQILNENPEKNHVISVDMWLKHSYQWFMPGGPYSSSSAGEREDWFEEISNFFDAFMNITNRNWADGKKRWLTHENLKGSDRGGNRPYIQYKTTIRALMHQLPLVVERIRTSGYEERIIRTERFENAMLPLMNIDWLDRRIKSFYLPQGGGERAWQCLEQWFKDSLSRGEVEAYSLQEVMSESTPSKAGKGILSPTSKGEIWFDDENHTWPTPERPVRIVSKRPINAYHLAEGHFSDLEGNRLNEDAKVRRTSGTTANGTCVFVVHHGDWVMNCNNAKLTITWGNAIKKEVSNWIDLNKNG